MIDRVEKRLLDWAVQVIGGMARQYKSPMAAILESGVKSSPSGHWTNEIRVSPVTHQAQRITANMRAGSGQGQRGKGPVVLIDEEPMEVEGAVRKLPEVLRQVVKVQYLREGLSAKGKAKAAGVSVPTYYRHLDAAHVLLDVELFGSQGPRVA
ncbi:hypothetical protein [Microbulbifer sp. THAF38]|uniref:hypothetical protein n=1 Tax=Microbulbifer sp. THAF38 TaxID=2587856 RepID=UPI0012688BA7|nr:hypothetical protein [Microbulbifer sp. THAF38]QFT53528.1 hypothetical protein FIU95_02945 [Microbulbifer sp. THAF38]